MEQGFLDALRECPDDRLNHLAYADWLDDQGQAERAGYIRDWWRVTDLPGRARGAAHEALHKQFFQSFFRWIGPLGEQVSSTFAGAVLSKLEAGPSFSLEAVALLLEQHAVRELVIRRMPPAWELARLPGFRLIRELTLAGGGADDFFLWAHLPPLRRLTFGDLDTSTARLLAVTAGLRSLRSIGGRADGLDDAGVMALLKSPHLHGLEEWDLTGDRVTPLSLLHLFRGGRAKCWRSLTYTNDLATLADIRPIETCENLRRLTLALPPYLADDRPLECLNRLGRLRELRLARVGPTALSHLGAWPGLRHLEVLSIRGRYDLVAGSLRPLLDSPFLDPGTILDIPGVTP